MSMKQKLNADGLTLVELLVCIVVASVIIGSLTSVVTTYLHVAQRGRYLNLANSFVEAKVESLRNTGYNSLALGTTNLTNELPSQLPPSRSAAMTVTSPQAGLKQVYLSVTYKDQGTNQTNNYTTYIGELGVGQ